MFGKLWEFIRGVISKMIGSKSIETALSVTPYISTDMSEAIELWNNIYLDKAPWLHEYSTAEPFVVRSLNLGAFVASEKARMATIEMKSEITEPVQEIAATAITPDTEVIEGTNVAKPVKKEATRADYLNTQYKKLLKDLRRQLEYGIAKGGLVIKPYPIPDKKEIGFNYIQADSFYPISFNSAGDVTEAVFAERVTEKNLIFTHLEYHKLNGNIVTVINKAYKRSTSNNTNTANHAGVDLGVEVPLTDIEAWKDLQEETQIQNMDRLLFAYFRMPEANTIDVYSPLGVSGFARAVKLIEEADKQYSRILWEFEGSELAIDTDRDALKISKDAQGNDTTVLSRLQQRLFRKVDLNDEGTYEVFNPNIRDDSLFNGLNKILMRIEDLCALSRGTIADVTSEARTATELKILKQRSFSANVDIQAAIEETLEDVIYIMDVHATLYNLAPKGAFETSYEWDDSIIVDKEAELGKRLTLMQNGLESKIRVRMWYFGETKNQAMEALAEIAQEVKEMMALQNPPGSDGDMGEDEPEMDEDGDMPEGDGKNKVPGKKFPPDKKAIGKEG